MLEKLKNLKTESVVALEDLMALSAFATSLLSAYDAHKVAVPEWITDANAALSREIKTRVRDELEARLKKIKAQRESLKTAEEKRAALDREAAELEAALGSAP